MGDAAALFEGDGKACVDGVDDGVGDGEGAEATTIGAPLEDESEVLEAIPPPCELVALPDVPPPPPHPTKTNTTIISNRLTAMCFLCNLTAFPWTRLLNILSKTA